MNPQPTAVSVTLPVGLALERVKRMLFRPFDLGKWFVIGVAAWLAQLGEGGAGANFPTGSGHGDADVNGAVQQAKDYAMANLAWLVPLVIGLVILGLAIWILLTWLSSRGRFMFLHCVALDKAEIGEPWSKYSREASSLFWFRIVLGLIAMVPLLPLVLLAIFLLLSLAGHGQPNVGAILALVGVGLLTMAVALLFNLIGMFTTDFAVPIMYLRRGACRAAWRELVGLLSAQTGVFALYVLMRIALAMAISMIVLGCVLVTCCTACCLLLVPFIGTVALLPVLVFKRSYALHFLAQFGSQFDVFPPTTPAVGPLPPKWNT